MCLNEEEISRRKKHPDIKEKKNAQNSIVDPSLSYVPCLPQATQKSCGAQQCLFFFHSTITPTTTRTDNLPILPHGIVDKVVLPQLDSTSNLV